MTVFFLFLSQNRIQSQPIASRHRADQLKSMEEKRQLTGLKSTASTGQMLDSTVWEKWDSLADHFVFTGKDEYAYDGMGNCTLLSSFRWNQTRGDWEKFYREVSEYFSPGKLLLSVYQTGDSASDQWVNSFKTVNQWDGNGRDRGNEDYQWSKAGELWKPDSKTEKNYDGNGYQNLLAYYYGDTITGQWVGYSKYESILDSKGQINEYVASVWDRDNNQWLPTQKKTNTWNQAGNLVLNMFYLYDAENAQWVEDSKEERVYNSDGTPDSVLISLWIENKGGWIKLSKDEYQYDDQGREILLTSFTWDPSTGEVAYGGQVDYVYNADSLNTIISSLWDRVNEKWIPANKKDYTEAFNIETLTAYYSWDSMSDQWKGSSKYEKGISDSGIVLWEIYSEWDDNASLFVPTDSVEFSNYLNGHVYTQSVWDTLSGSWIFDLKSHDTYNADGNIVLDESYDWDINTSQWKDSEKTTWYYSEHTYSPVPGTNESQLRVYPNPASEYIVFDLEDMSSPAEICLFDSQGRQVLERSFSGNEPIRLGNLVGGIYLYKVTVGEKVFNGKIIIR
jgi:hypothetical protein